VYQWRTAQLRCCSPCRDRTIGDSIVSRSSLQLQTVTMGSDRCDNLRSGKSYRSIGPRVRSSTPCSICLRGHLCEGLTSEAPCHLTSSRAHARPSESLSQYPYVPCICLGGVTLAAVRRCSRAPSSGIWCYSQRRLLLPEDSFSMTQCNPSP